MLGARRGFTGSAGPQPPGRLGGVKGDAPPAGPGARALPAAPGGPPDVGGAPRRGAAVSPYAIRAIVAVTLITVVIGAYGLRLARTTSDFLVASRVISPTWNAAAIGGEYLSAASFLGVAGLILKDGVTMLWYPVGVAPRDLAPMLFVAAPLRRSGAYTLPDFCQ